MHEMSIVMNIIELAAKAAETEGAKAISGVELDVGALAGVMVESLEFCFEAACINTIAQGAELKVHKIPGKGKCMACNLEFPVESIPMQCPQCDQFLLNITQGRDLRIRAITIDE